MSIYDTTAPDQLLAGMRLARAAIARGELVVIPTDTVYGVGVDAFSPDAVGKLLAAKGRDRSSPPPVLVSDTTGLDALAELVPEVVRDLVEKFWPGGLTIILPARVSLDWDLGDTHGTVALRCPSHPITLELLAETGPLAVSSANRSGEAPALTVWQAHDALGEKVSVYLDAGRVGQKYLEANEKTSSTIVDATGLALLEGKLRIVRDGVIPRKQIIELVGEDKCE